MDTKALRQKILDLAIRGKLVPQDPNDEPASVLLERIRAEKQQMIKDGKLKPKDIKNDTVIFKGDDNLHYEKFADGTVKCCDFESDYEIPNNWAWCNLGLLFNHNTGKALNSANSEGKTLTYITTSNVYWNRFELDDLKSMPFTDSEIEKCTVTKGDLLVCEGGDIGRAAIWNFDDEIRIQNHLHRLRAYDDIQAIFYYYVLYIFKLSGKISGNGIGLQGLSSNVLHNIIVPVPPIDEQKRIARAVEKSLSLITSIENHKEILSSYIDYAKSKILDLAIRGKLVPQDPNDEPASVLLERIKAEKEELIKQGKIKRDKKESVIFKGDDNSYYQNLPENWEVTTLRELTSSLTLNDGDWILSENMTTNGEVKLLQLGSIGNMIYIDNGFKYLTKSTFNKLSCTEIFPGYLLINRIISDKMCCCIVPDIAGTIITTVDTCWIAPSNTSYNVKFLMYQLASPIFQSVVLLNATGTTRKRISKNNLINLQLLLPPLTEQKRIVEAIETIFAELDEISKQVT